jgi:glycosyltransferase involved in cell wall biosynthesis
MAQSNTKNQKIKPVILQVLPELKSGGVERGTVEIVKALVANGFDAMVASSGGHMANHITLASGIHIKLPLASKNPFTIYRNIGRLAKIIKKYDVDVVHARSRAPAWSAYFACKRTKCHFITTFHGVYSTRTPFKKWYNSVMVKGERVIAISEFIKNHMKTLYKAREDKIVVIHRGVDLEQFDHDKVPRSRIIHNAEELKIDYDRPVILLPGRITSWKGHEFLLEALAKIPSDKYMCLFAGDNSKHKSYLKTLNKKIRDSGLGGSVRIINNVHDMPALYSLVDIVISASVRPEAFGRVAIEAQAMERLVIATNHGGACETVIDGKTGWLVEPNDAEGLAEILNKLFAITEKKRKTITKAAKQHIQNHFSLETMTSQTLDVYRDILKPKKSKKS